MIARSLSGRAVFGNGKSAMRECNLGWEEGVWRSRGGRWGRTCGGDVFRNSRTVGFENSAKISGAWVDEGMHLVIRRLGSGRERRKEAVGG